MTTEPVTDVLLGRIREPAGLRAMVALSVGLHVVVGFAMAVTPNLWGPAHDAEPRTVMTISLGGGPGPRAGGSNAIGGRPIQAVGRPEAAPSTRPEPDRPPAARTPEMTLPSPKARTTTRSEPPSPDVKMAPEEARGRKPIFGDQERFGSAVAETGGVGFGGLTTGGGGAMGGGYLDVGNFCCPDYLATMQRLIQGNWNSRQPVAGASTLKYTIQRSGRIVGVEVEKSSGFAALDLSAQRALLVTQLPPLPSAFPEDSLTVHLIFDYRR